MAHLQIKIHNWPIPWLHLFPCPVLVLTGPQDIHMSGQDSYSLDTTVPSHWPCNFWAFGFPKGFQKGEIKYTIERKSTKVIVSVTGLWHTPLLKSQTSSFAWLSYMLSVNLIHTVPCQLDTCFRLTWYTLYLVNKCTTHTCSQLTLRSQPNVSTCMFSVKDCPMT